MKSPLRLFICLAALTSCSLWAADSALATHGSNYHAAGKAIVDMVISKKIELPAVTAKVDTLLTEATALGEAYAKAYPAGAKLLKTVIGNIPEMKKLSYAELQTEWHDLGYFAKPGRDVGLDLKSEDNEHFTDPIHAIVHPLLVLRAAQDYAADKKDEHLKAMKEEMEEGLEQAEKLVLKLSR
jgi:hypothetical protein